MIKEILKLLEIQDIDLHVFELKVRQNELPATLRDLKKDVVDKKSELQRVVAESKELKAHQKNLEGEIESHKATITKYKNQLLELKSNEQYRALLSEIKLHENKCVDIEDQILTSMMTSDEKDSLITQSEANLKESEQNLNDRADEIKQAIARVDEEIKQLQDTRLKLKEDINPQAMRLYERVMKNKGELKAMVPVVDSTCQGCYMKMTPNDVIEVRKSHKIQTCENCARILYWPYSEE